MKKTLFSLFILCLGLSACAKDPNGYLKRSANNKLFDRQGFHGKKRRPLYNEKHIKQAKENIKTGRTEELDEEDMVGLQRNREMYEEMLEQEQGSRAPKHNRPSFFQGKKRLQEYKDSPREKEINAELEEIKTLLEKTREEMNSRRCPTIEDMERKHKKPASIRKIREI